MVKFLTSLCFVAFFVAGCRQKTNEAPRKLQFDAFVPSYNRYIETWLKNQQAETEKEIANVTTRLTTVQGDAKATLETKAKALTLDQEKWSFRLGLGPFLKFSNPSEIPADLVWENGLDQPEIGDPRAKKGGVFRKYIPSFPPTLRPFGENSNHAFRGDLYDMIEMPLVGFHPATMEMIPGLAKEWATSSDGRTIYFRLDPEARYSDGVPVKARDFLVAIYLRVSDEVVNPFSKQYYRENIAQLATYDDLTLSISLPERKIYAPAIAGGNSPSPPHFYTDYGPDYSERYQWLFPPTTGAYEVQPQDIIKGVSITQTRVKNWWAKDRKYYQYRFNPDLIVHRVIRDDSKAFELFRAGEIDTFLLTRPQLWYEKSEVEPVFEGFIERVTFYNQYPKIPRGFYLNVSKPPLDNLDVRIGIDHSLNWQKVINVLFRGDYQKLNAFNEGYGIFSDPSIIARPYSIPAARAAFAKAGYTQDGPDGIFTKPDGKRLTVAVTYSSIPASDEILTILREDAKSCGLELRLDGLEGNVAYKKQMQKQHEIAFSGWNTNPPIPDFHEFLHSTTALEVNGSPMPNTNNLFVWHRADTDILCEDVRNARTSDELKNAAWQLQKIMHDEAIFLPGYSVDFVRVGSWRWIKWPDCETTRFSPPVVYEPHEAFTFWIDDDLKAETLTARRTGKTFPESTRIMDDYRSKPALNEEAKEP